MSVIVEVIDFSRGINDKSEEFLFAVTFGSDPTPNGVRFSKGVFISGPV
jgi:hypothetical protein